MSMEDECDFALLYIQRSDPPAIFEIVKNYLQPFDSVSNKPDELLSLYNKHIRFINESMVYIHDMIHTCRTIRPIPSELFKSYQLLLSCLRKVSTVMDHNHLILMYKRWWLLIACYIDNDNFYFANYEIERFEAFLGREIMVPAPDDKELSVIMLNVLLCHIQCLVNNHALRELVLVMDGIHPSWRVLDEDRSSFTWLASFLTCTATCLLVKKPDMSNQEGRLTAKLSALILLEHTQLSRLNVTQELRTLIKLEFFSTHDFLWTVLDHVAEKTNAERQRAEDTKEWDVDSTYRSCLKQLQELEQRSCLHPTLCKTIQSSISDRLLPKILSKQEKSLNYIAMGRKFRLKGIERLDDSYECLEKAISEINDLDSYKQDEYGAACHVRAIALCLRALCTNERLGNSEDCMKDIKEAVQLWLDKNYCQFVAEHSYLSLTTVKLLCYVCDMIFLEVKLEGDKELFEMLIQLFNQSSNGVKECVAMLWQSRSRSHALCTSHESVRFLETVLESCNEEWANYISSSNDIKAICTASHTEKLKHVAFELLRKDPGTKKSSYLAAYIYYDLGDRMILQGSLSEALFYAKKSRMLRESLYQKSFKVSTKEQDGMVRCHVDPLLATNAWSTDYEDFILTPNNILRCYLESILQEGTLSEILGYGEVAQKFLLLGKELSLGRSWSILGVRFSVAIGKVYRKKQLWELAEQELINARKHCSSIACKNCKAVLEDEISQEFGKFYTRMYQNELKDMYYQEAMSHFASCERGLKNELLRMNARYEVAQCGCEAITYASDAWALERRICLLRVLTQKAKCFVTKGDMNNAEQVLLESACLVVCMRSFCSSHSTMLFSYLVELVKENKIKHVPRMEIANLLYIMSWVSLMNSTDKGKRKKSSDKWFTPLSTLISGLKLALIMSTKAPELCRKVAQLLAILCALLPDIVPPVGAPSACQWSCFFHQLTLGSNLTSMYYSHLKEMYHVSDPDAILHSLPPNLDDVGLEEFVLKYYEALPPHTILGITILKDKYMGLMEILLGESSMPSKYGAHLMMSRFKSNAEPLVVLLPLEPITVFARSKDCPSLFRGTGQNRSCPWGTKTIVDKIVPGFQKLSDYIALSFIPNGKYTQQNDSSLVDWKNYLDERVGNLVRRMEKWFGCCKHILLGEDKSGCHILTNQEVDIDIQSKRQRGGNLTKEPVIMVLDIDINMLPWETMSVLRNQEVYRMPSISSIFYTYYRSMPSDKKRVKDSTVYYPVLNPRNAYYVVNPDITRASASQSEIWVVDQLRNIYHLKGKSFEPIDEANEILNMLVTHDHYLYMGHGDGFQYIPRDKVVELLRCAATMLMGCNSALLSLNGPYIPSGAPLDYILAGSPIAIGNLWAVFPYGSLIVLMTLYESWIRYMAQDGEAGMGSFLVKARESPSHIFNYLDGAATVCYGIPTRIQKRKPEIRRRKLNIRRNLS